jgi:3-hydroxyisobutyrate dehydrogenase-like beta-hydroxyacid dehydrogenase
MSEQDKPIGLLGVGLLGTAIAERLLEVGHQVCGFDVRPARLDRLERAGGERCGSIAELLNRSEVIILSLPHSRTSREVLTDGSDSLRSGQTVIDTTTGDPDEMIALCEMLMKRGVRYVEATVAGSSAQMRIGQACLFVAGDEMTVQGIQDLLEEISSKHFYLGAVGSASRFKLVHNLVLGLNRAVLAEGLSFAKVLGFDEAHVLAILKQTPAHSTVMETKGQKMVAGDRVPQARLSQHLKDVELIIAAAQQGGLETPLSRAHWELLQQAVELGFGDADNSAVIEVYRKQGGRSS